MHTIELRPTLIRPMQGLRQFASYFGGFAASVTVRAADLLLTWQERATQRHALASLDGNMLRDIGLSRADAVHEAGKPFWRA